MKLKKKYIDILFSVLGETKPPLATARIRDQFLRQLQDHYKVMTEDRKTAIETYCVKDEEGNPKFSKQEGGVGTYSFKDGDLAKAEEELSVLIEEEVDIDVIPENLTKIKTLIEESEYKPKFGEAEEIYKLIEELV